jgi:hypothetical protein
MEKAVWGKEQEIFTVEIVDRDPPMSYQLVSSIKKQRVEATHLLHGNRDRLWHQ